MQRANDLSRQRSALEADVAREREAALHAAKERDRAMQIAENIKSSVRVLSMSSFPDRLRVCCD